MAEQMTDDQIRITILQINIAALLADTSIREAAAATLDLLGTIKMPTEADYKFSLDARRVFEACKCQEQKNLAGGQTDGAKQKASTTKETV